MSKLWLISQSENRGFDTFDSAVVVADDPDSAKQIHPDGHENPEVHTPWSTWAPPSFVDATFIGETDRPAGEVICASFNAG